MAGFSLAIGGEQIQACLVGDEFNFGDIHTHD